MFKATKLYSVKRQIALILYDPLEVYAFILTTSRAKLPFASQRGLLFIYIFKNMQIASFPS